MAREGFGLNESRRVCGQEKLRVELADVRGPRGKRNLGATPRADDVAVWPEATDAPLPRKGSRELQNRCVAEALWKLAP
jgi:hypothetical protein